MIELKEIKDAIFDDLTSRKNFDDVMAAIGIMLVLKHSNKNEEFLQYLKEHPEQDFYELMQVAFAYIAK